ncbi:MAG: hypothetical protein ABI675_02140 [Chitinophagaceae bacterium]
MLAIISKTKAVKRLAGFAICAVVLSFSHRPGGEGFEISLNNKVVLQQFGKNMDAVKTLNLDQASANDEISVKYYHCGRVGKNRIITVKDDQDRVLKQWKFSDVSDAAAQMTCKVKDIMSLKIGKNSTLKLYYSSSELPKERQLASISAGTKSVAQL